MNILKYLIILFTFFFCLPSLFAQDGESRYKFFDVTQYSFQIGLNDSTDVIRGEAELKITLRQKADTLKLDLANVNSAGRGMFVDEIKGENGLVSFKHVSDQILIPVSDIPENKNTSYKIKYHGIPADGLIISKNKFGDRTFFGDNWPNRAHQWLPCIDHPADKAVLEFTVVAPSHYQVVSNGTCTGEQIQDGILTSRWKSDVPLPTKLMVIGVAEFAKQDLAIISGFPISSWVYPQNKNEGFRDYSAAIKPFIWFSSLIAPFPFSKLANVQSTTYYGGMENAGCIFYAENSVTGLSTAERLMAHEIAHQWFGDAVTEKDWYHIWLSEGFATYLTGMYIEHTYGRGAFQNYLKLGKEEVFAFDKRHSISIIDTSLSISPELLSPVTYEKASWVLHILRKELGDSLFIDCLQTFYKDFKYKNADSNDFIKVVESLSGRDFTAFFEQWLNRPGHPSLEISWRYDDQKLSIKVKQLQEGPAYSFPLELKIINKKSVSEQISLKITSAEEEFTVSCMQNPMELIPDPGNWLLSEFVVISTSPSK